LKSKEEYAKTERERFKCNKCEETFISKKTLKKHVVEVHPITLNCKICDRTFFKNHELEIHIEEHGVEKNFKCDVCNKDFYLEWRFEKHPSVHSEETRICQYFSRSKHCPFEKIGCK
jgi:KRAB domain-containing zinc finger protein